MGVEVAAIFQIAPPQRLDGLGVEVTLAPDALAGEVIFDPLDVLPQQEGRTGSTEAELLAVDDLRREQVAGQALEDVFFCEALQLEVGRNLAHEFDEINVQEGIAPLDRI